MRKFGALALLASCACANPAPRTSDDTSTAPSTGPRGDSDSPDAAGAQESMATRLTIRVGEAMWIATLQDNETARVFRSMLPLTLAMTDLHANEKYYELMQSLPVDASNPGTIRAGDVMLYGDRTLVLFYGTLSTSYRYTRIGKVDDVSGLAAALGARDVTVTFGP